MALKALCDWALLTSVSPFSAIVPLVTVLYPQWSSVGFTNTKTPSCLWPSLGLSQNGLLFHLGMTASFSWNVTSPAEPPLILPSQLALPCSLLP